MNHAINLWCVKISFIACLAIFVISHIVNNFMYMCLNGEKGNVPLYRLLCLFDWQKHDIATQKYKVSSSVLMSPAKGYT